MLVKSISNSGYRAGLGATAAYSARKEFSALTPVEVKTLLWPVYYNAILYLL